MNLPIILEGFPDITRAKITHDVMVLINQRNQNVEWLEQISKIPNCPVIGTDKSTAPFRFEITDAGYRSQFQIKSDFDYRIAVIDRQCWYCLFNQTDQFGLFNSKQKKQFLDQVNKAPPEFTFDIVQGTLNRLSENSNMSIAEGVYDAFVMLDRSFKNNAVNKICTKTKIIMDHYVDNTYKNNPRPATYGWKADALADLERAVRAANGDFTPLERGDSIVTYLYNEVVYRNRLRENLTKNGITVKAFKSGTIWIMFEPHVIDALNRCLAEASKNALFNAKKD